MKRILVIGTSGSGKSVYAAELSARLGLPFFPTDHFYWQPGWRNAPAEEVRRQVGDVTSAEAWVLDGNFDEERELVWGRADCIIWLDYSLLVVGWRVISRNLGWLLTGQPTWSGNRMTLARAISGARHALRSHALKKRKYPQWLPLFPKAEVLHFRSSRAAQAWLESLPPSR